MGTIARKVFFWSVLFAVYVLCPVACARDVGELWGAPLGIDWSLILKAFVLLGPVLFVLVILYRKNVQSLELHLTYAPFLAWLVSFFAFKVLSWFLFKGVAMIGPYGRDKGLSNFMMVEPPLLALLVGLVLVVSLATKNKSYGTSKWSRRLSISFAILIGLLVALVIPPLPD